jgi:hypothetical protein
MHERAAKREQGMTARWKRIHGLLHRAVDWAMIGSEEAEHAVEAIHRLRAFAFRLLRLTWRREVKESAGDGLSKR